MAITTRDGLVAALASAEREVLYKASIANAVANTWHSLWRATGQPAQGGTPAAAATCTNATTGAVPFTTPGSGNSYVLGWDLQLANVGSCVLYDRLAHMGGLSGTVFTPTAQTVNVTIPASRDAAVDGSDVEWFLEWYSDTGGTGVNATVTYTDQLDATGNTVVVALVATTRAGRLYPIPPPAGKFIKSIQSVTLSATTGTAGNFGVTVAKRVASVPVAVTNQIATRDAFQIGIPKVPTNACLWIAMFCSTTSTGVVNGQVVVGSG
jgi:hypothetical protein